MFTNQCPSGDPFPTHRQSFGGLSSILSALALAALLPLSGVAQEPSDTVRLTPIDVTVLRTPITLDNSPLAVGVLTESDLRSARSGAFLEEALKGLPGVHVQNRYNFAVGERVVVRGFGGRAQFGARGVRLIVDGIPATLADGQGTLDHLDVGSLGRVEVVRGAASALFGNASGGVLSFSSRLPAAERLRLETEYVGGSHGLSRFQGNASGTIQGTGYLLSFSAQGWEGYRPTPTSVVDLRSYGSADRISANAQLRRTIGGGALALTLNYLDLDSENPGQLLKSQVDSLVLLAHGAGPVNNITREAGKSISQTQFGMTWNRPMGELTGDFSLFGISRKTINPIVPTIIDLNRDAGGVRAQLSGARATARGPLTWHMGAEAEFMFDDRLNFVNNNGERGNMTVDQRERVRSTGLFLQANVPLPGGILGLGGLRYDRHDFRAWDHIARTGNDVTRTGERTMSKVSPSVGISMPVSTSYNLFANVATVFETPSTTELGNRPDGEGGFNPDLNPQTGVSGEIGIRGRPTTTTSFEVSVYRTDLKNEIVRYQITELPGRDFFRNAGTSRHTGVEATLTATSPGGLVEGRTSYTLTNARFRSFVQDGVEVGGNRIPGLAPRHAELSLRLNLPDLTPSATGLFAELSWNHVGPVPVNDRNTEGFDAPAYSLLDLRGGLGEVRISRLTFAPWAAVTNLLDEYFVASVVPNAAGASPAASRFYDPGPGRSIQMGLRAAW